MTKLLNRFGGSASDCVMESARMGDCGVNGEEWLKIRKREGGEKNIKIGNQ